MIYILEGHNCAGKSTYAESLNLPIKRGAYSKIEQIEEALQEDNIVWDRLFGYGYYWNHKTDEDLRKLNEYLKSLPNVKCIKFTCSKEASINRLMEKHNYSKELATEEGTKVYNFFNHMFEIMNVFKEV